MAQAIGVLALGWSRAVLTLTFIAAGGLAKGFVASRSRTWAVTALMDGTDVLGVGILTVPSKAEAEQLLRADPSVQGGRFTMQIVSGPTFSASEIQI